MSATTSNPALGNGPFGTGSLWPFQPPTMPDGSLAPPWSWQFWVGLPGVNMPNSQAQTGNASPGGGKGQGPLLQQVLEAFFGVSSPSEVLVDVFVAIGAIALLVLGIAGFIL